MASWEDQGDEARAIPTKGRKKLTAKQAVLVDALGTLVEMEPPWIGLRAAVPDSIDDERLVQAVKAEMAYYRDHASEGHDDASVADLRDRCARVLSEGLGHEVDAGTLVSSLSFRPYPDAAPALEALRARGLRIVCLSNWDVSLTEVLEGCGLDEHLDGAVSSAEAGASKPDPAPFRIALEVAECEPSEALHVGDTADEDLAGAAAADVSALLLDRTGQASAPEGAVVISSLVEVEDHLNLP